METVQPKKEVSPLFRVHRLNEEGMKKAMSIANGFDALLALLEDHCDTTSREFAVTKTKLEEACFFAKKSMANVPENQA